MQRVVLLGPPGAGKGTQGARLAAVWGVPHIASGTILRRLVATEKGDLAQQARVINEGKMIPDRVANAVVLKELEKPSALEGFVLDGYPRDVPQARVLDEFLEGRKQRLNAVVLLQVAEGTLITRLAGRLTCPACGESYHVAAAPPRVSGRCDRCGGALVVREDDQPAWVRTRLAVYEEKTKPLMAYYRARGLLHVTSAEGTEDEVFALVFRSAGAGGTTDSMVL